MATKNLVLYRGRKIIKIAQLMTYNGTTRRDFYRLSNINPLDTRLSTSPRRVSSRFIVSLAGQNPSSNYDSYTVVL